MKNKEEEILIYKDNIYKIWYYPKRNIGNILLFHKNNGLNNYVGTYTIERIYDFYLNIVNKYRELASNEIELLKKVHQKLITEIKYLQIGDPVKLIYDQEDLELEDLGMSGIVLPGLFSNIPDYIFEKNDFRFGGTIKERDDEFFIYCEHNGKTHHFRIISARFLQTNFNPHPF